MGTLPPPPFPLDNPAQSLSARRAAESLARAATRKREVDFAPRPVAARKIRICRWALALARRHHTLGRRDWRRGAACLGCRCPQALGATRPILPVLRLAFFPTVGGLPILSAGTSASPATSGRAALRATVSGLGTGGMKILLASLEQAWPLPRPTCPLTGPNLAASWMWAQGSCELPAAKPRTRSFLPPLRGALLDHHPLLRSVAPCQPVYNHQPARPSDTDGYQPTETNRLQSGTRLTQRVVPSWIVTDSRTRSMIHWGVLSREETGT
jgi:hypothetical protein